MASSVSDLFMVVSSIKILDGTSCNCHPSEASQKNNNKQTNSKQRGPMAHPDGMSICWSLVCISNVYGVARTSTKPNFMVFLFIKVISQCV